MTIKGTIWEILSLVLSTNLKNRAIAKRAGVAPNTVKRYRREAVRVGLTLERLHELSETELDQIFNKAARRLSKKREPDWAYISAERQKPGVTRFLLWMEYREEDPETVLSRSQFNTKLENYERRNRISLRKVRIPGESIEIDFAGKKEDNKISWTDASTGKIHEIELFVAAAGAAGRIFACATPNQQQPSFIEANNKMVAYYGGVLRNVICDNLRPGITKARGRDSDPVINRTYLEWGRHNHTVIIPTDPYRPKHKGLVEGAVRIAQRWIVARLRKHKFFSLGEINAQIARLVEDINNRPFRGEPGTRNTKFEELDRPLLTPLPEQPFEYAEWQSKVRVDPSYHVAVLGHFYSVPYTLVGEYVEPRITAATVELYHIGKRVAVHPRSYAAGRFTVCEDHMPPNHRAFAQLTPERLLSWAASVGPNTVSVATSMCEAGQSAHAIASRGGRLRRLERKYGKGRLEAACGKALQIHSPTISSIKSILQRQLDDIGQREARAQFQLPLHSNIRGASYYQPEEV